MEEHNFNLAIQAKYLEVITFLYIFRYLWFKVLTSFRKVMTGEVK